MRKGIFPTSTSRANYAQIGRNSSQPASYLRLEASIQPATTSTVTFNLLSNQGTPNVTERRLNLPDTFTAESIALFIMKAGAGVTATQAEISVSLLRTYPNPIIFTGTGEAVNLNAVYNSSLSITINRRRYLDAMDTFRFFRVPQSQQGVLGGTGGVIVQRDGYDSMNYGFSPLTPTITFSGQAQTDIVLTLPTSIALLGTTSQNFAVLVMRGFLNTNVAELNK